MPTSPRRGIVTDALSDDSDGPDQFARLVAAVDVDVVYAEGSSASRGSSTLKGKLHRATDTKEISLSTNDGWVSMGVKPRGTTLPSSPTDGQEFCWTVDPSNGIEWSMKYRASTGHWSVLGGPPLVAEVAAAQGPAGGSYGDLATAGPALTVPRAGDYMVEVAFTGSEGIMSYAIGATAASDDDAASQMNDRGDASVARERKKTLTAVTLTAKYKGASGGFSGRTLKLTPIRIVA